ncbi:unnamed protein product [Spirodela intermedia]|uniref:SHSP domain-containing protein n=1 Tax=Spirodela intermedia TaxID=51605 RepID=A0A7I8JRF6_SPIIN|nr:unnamed protein product [Spirodela intermedia]CAA6672345.1 unnamed protein product [Spirodela intermedia]
MIPALFKRHTINIFDPFSLDVWDPLQGFPFSNNDNSLFLLHRGLKGDPKAHVFTTNLPRVKKEAMKEGCILQIIGQRSKEKEQKNNRWHHIERNNGGFMRQFHLTKNAKADLIRASMENGVLTMTVPRRK